MVQRLVEAQSDATLEELCVQLSQQRGLRVSQPTMSRVLQRLGWPRVLGPALVPGDIVMLDNLAVHKVSGIQQMLARRRSRLRYLPPYSPDLAPIESCWSKLKTQLRTAQARTRDALDAAIAQALATVTPADAHGWFAHCGLFRTVT